MSRTEFRARAAGLPAPAGPGFLFNLHLTIAWLRIQLLCLLRPRAS
jgi:hypothetical protein